MQQSSDLEIEDNVILCTYPPRTDGLDFTIKEYKALKPREWISEQIVDFYLGYVRNQQNIDKERVMLFNTSLWHILDSQDRLPLIKRNTADNFQWIRDANLWKEGEPEILVLPVCRRGHWVAAVALLDPVSPTVVVFNSLGPSSCMPREARLFGNFLLKLRITPGPSIKTLCPSVPEQPNFADCGLFVIKYIQLVMQNPQTFVDLVRDPDPVSFGFWFDHQDVRVLRSEIGQLVVGLAKEQREEGGYLHSQQGELKLPIIDFTKVKEKGYI